ncbi:MAG: TolC family protein [Phycisphaerae bacterium]|nr:TolC family protein [Phycisphaerae bacterium]
MKKIKTIAIIGIFSVLFVSGCASENSQTDSGNYDWNKFDANNSRLTAASVSESLRLPELTENSGLPDYLAYAALNNPGLEAAFNRWKAALDRVPQVKALPDPRFTYRYFIEEVETRVGPQRQGFEISQLFPWFGKLELRGDIAGQAANAARQRYEAAKLKLFFEVKDAYYEYYYLTKSIAITKENIDLVRHLESVAQSRYKAAAGTHPDVIRAQVEMGKLEDRYRTQLDLQQPIVARLNAALNRPVDANIPWPTEIQFNDIAIIDQELLARLVVENPELKALDFEITQNKKNIELAKKEYYPDFTLGLGIIDTGDAIAGNPRDNGKDPVIAMVSVNIPLWHEKYSAGVREARSRYLAARGERTEKINSLSSTLKMALYRFRDAERKIDLYRDALLPKAEESLKVTESGFRTATATFTDLIDAQRILLEFALSYERALADRSQSLAKLEMLVGQQISRKENETGEPDAIDDGPDKENLRPEQK